MKYFETSFDSYLREVERVNIHREYEKYYSYFPERIKDMNHTIIYGVNACGKYSQMLKMISKYSPSNLKYEKKINIAIQKKSNFIFKISDIHYEIDMDLLGCNSKTIWSEFLSQVIDIICTTKNKEGFIVCKNFEKINLELLDIFYGYITNIPNNIHIRYILLTNCLSFLPQCFLDSFNILKFKKPSIIKYNRITNQKIKKKELHLVSNIKEIKGDSIPDKNKTHILSEKIIEYIKESESFNFHGLREYLYDILIYHFDIYEVLWCILEKLQNDIPIDKYYELNIEIYKFCLYYNNNYRPIFHIERIILYLLKVVRNID